MNRAVPWIVGIVALVAVALIGFAFYAAAQKRTQQKQVVALVEDTTEKLRQALNDKATPELFQAIDANLSALRAPRDFQLVDAAEHYILSAREISRRRVDTDKLWARATSSRQALAGHMARAERRSESWLRSAVALKKRVEDDYFEVSITLKALDELLYKLPEEEKRLEPRIGTAALLERSAIDAARKQAQADLRRADEEHGAAKRITP
jgi:hypothetical protein